jgi:hypothetical protein
VFHPYSFYLQKHKNAKQRRGGCGANRQQKAMPQCLAALWLIAKHLCKRRADKVAHNKVPKKKHNTFCIRFK